MKILLFLIALIPFFSGSQSVYRFNNYTINNGLSQSSVNTILQDENSALWIGTQDGLNRFDGAKFEVFNSDEIDGIDDPFITSSVKTSDGKLWFGTKNGLTVYDLDTESFRTHSPNNKKDLDITSLSIGNSEEIWISTANQGLLKFNPQSKVFVSVDWGNSAKDIYSVTLFDDLLIIRTSTQGLYLYNVANKTAKRIRTDVLGFSDFEILDISVASDNQIYLGSNYGVFQLDYRSNCLIRKFQGYPKLLTSQVIDICLSQGQWFFATSDNGLLTIDDEGELINSTQDMFQKRALMYDNLNVLFEDRHKKIWIGSDRGVSSFDPKYSGFIGVGPGANPKESLPSPNVWTFSEDKSGKYLNVGTDLGISRLNRYTGLFSHFNRWSNDKNSKEAKHNVLSSFCVDSNQILVGFIDGLFRLDIINDSSHKYTRLEYVNPLLLSKYNRIYGIERESEDTYFLATKGAVFLYNVKTGKAQRFEHNVNRPKESLSPGICRVIYKDRKGRIWFATNSGGINELVVNEYGNYSIKPHPINKKIRAVCKGYGTTLCDDEKGNLYMGTYGSGMVYIDFVSEKIKVINKKRGLPNNIIYGVINDGNEIWVSTNKGIASYNPISSEIKSYLEVHGLVSNEFNSNAYFNSKTGELFFGSIYGYNVFRPDQLNIGDTDQEVIITKFKLNKGWLRPGQEGSPLKMPIAKTKFIELPYSNRSFTIRFQTSDLSNPELTQFKYELIGTSTGEQPLENRHELSFNSLSPGDYTLKIYAKLGEGKWSSVPTTLEISILPPYWGTWWFWTLAALMISVFAFLFFKRRIESERREQVKLEIKVTERTREISNQKSRIEEQSKLIEAEKNKVLEQQKLLQVEKDNAERWLANALPEEVVRELKVNGKVEANAFNKVTVMFTDVVGFTNISQRMRPSRLVKRLDVLFRRFDELVQGNDLEKIKTIGDAYMCAGGIPVENSINPMNACIAALQIQNYMSKLKFDAIANHSDYWELRLGIHTGPVVAGIIGDLKLAYDIWGPTVNQAQQMEKYGAPGEVTISGTTFTFIEPYFECEYKGKVLIKGGIEVDMYSVLKIKPELSNKGQGLFPNAKFSEIVQLHHFSSINYYKTEHFVLDYLKEGLSDKLLYHSVNHSIDVVHAVERIALSEGVTDEGLFLLKTAAILHDAGFVKQYENNESIGAQMASEWLPNYGYTEQHIKTIVELIHVTAIPHKPINKLQEIICDADLDYLGRDDFEEISNRLRLELRRMEKIDSDRGWDKIQISFLKTHKYFTKTSIVARRKKKRENLKKVIKRLDDDEYVD